MNPAPSNRQKSLRAEQVAPLEALIQGWPEVWREFARSAFVTLHACGFPAGDQSTQLAMLLAQAIVKDFGGQQLYIPRKIAAEGAASTPAQAAPLEALCSGWPEVWRKFARSAHDTLQARELPKGIDSAQLAVQVAQGIVEDFGGLQPYITLGTEVRKEERFMQMLVLLKKGQSLRRVAVATGVSERTARRAETQYRAVVQLLSRGTAHTDIAQKLGIDAGRVRAIEALARRHEDRAPSPSTEAKHTARSADTSRVPCAASPPAIPQPHWPFPNLPTSNTP